MGAMRQKSGNSRKFPAVDNGLHASVRLVESDYPLMALWQLCQHPDTEETLDLDTLGGDRC